MGLFRNKGRRDSPGDASGDPASYVPDVDVRVAEKALQQAIEATHSNGRLGNDDIEVIVQRLLKLGGAVFDQLGSPEVRRRPWDWLLATASQASATGENLCVIYSAFWIHTWRHEMFPRFGPYEFVTYGTDQVPDEVAAAIHALTVDALTHFSDDQILFGDASGSITVGFMREHLDALLLS